MSNFSGFSSTTIPSISEDSLQVPETLFVKGIEVDLKSIRGTGSYGTVYVAVWYETKVAAKKLHEIFFEDLVTPESKFGILKSFAREVNMLMQLKHPNVVQFYGLYKSSGVRTLELSPDTYLIQELMHCALDVRNRQSPQLTVRNVVNIGLNIAGGLRYLHERTDPIIHRDLASKNILLSATGMAKIADLGVARILEHGNRTPQSRLPGTELYMPPEVKIEGIHYDTRVDIYSFGVILLEVSIGRDAKANEAFRVGSGHSIILAPEIDRRKADFEALGNHPVKPIILSCLGHREERPTAREISLQLFSFTKSEGYQSMKDTPILSIPSRSSDATSLIQVKDLQACCKILEDKAQKLQEDKNIIQMKLDSHLSSDCEEQFTSKEMDQQIDTLMSENASLQNILVMKDKQIAQLRLSLSPPFNEPKREQESLLLQKLDDSEKSNKQEVQRLQLKIQSILAENTSLHQKLKVLKGHFMSQTHPRVPYSETEYGCGSCGEGHTSLPEQLLSSSSFNSGSDLPETRKSSVSADPLPDLNTLHISSASSLSSNPRSVMSGAPDRVAPASSNLSEIKKLKKQLDRFQSVNVELDQRLKEAQLQLQKYSGRHTNTDIMNRAEVSRLREENNRLQVRLNHIQYENNQLKTSAQRWY